MPSAGSLAVIFQPAFLSFVSAVIYLRVFAFVFLAYIAYGCSIG